MPNFIRAACGTQYAECEQSPIVCSICEDERQYVKVTGQQWATHEKLRLTNRNKTKTLGEGLTLIRCGGHFEGGTVLYWQGGADSKGALLTGDIIEVVANAARKNSLSEGETSRRLDTNSSPVEPPSW